MESAVSLSVNQVEAEVNIVVDEYQEPQVQEQGDTIQKIFHDFRENVRQNFAKFDDFILAIFREIQNNNAISQPLYSDPQQWSFPNGLRKEGYEAERI